MKIKTRICLVTTISLVTCCIVLWALNFLSTSHLMKDIKSLESVEEPKSYAKLVAIEDKEDKNVDRLIVSLISVIIFGGGATFFAVNRALKPFRKLSKKIRDFHTSDLKTPIPLPKTKDESYELFSSYNIMLNKLNQAFEREKRITANIAHEFKTPLSVLITSCEVLEMKANPSIKDYKHVVDITKEKAEYLSEITSSLLAIHRQTQKLNNVKCDLQEMLNSIKEDLTMTASKRNISLNVVCEPLTIFCDKLLFGQMLNNFIENAVKYNKDGGFVDVKVSTADDNTISILISDSGKGIPDDVKDLIFEPFYRVDESRNKEYGGVGLGLPFAKLVADLYRGDIKIENNTPVGTNITLTFPEIIINQ